MSSRRPELPTRLRANTTNIEALAGHVLALENVVTRLINELVDHQNIMVEDVEAITRPPGDPIGPPVGGHAYDITFRRIRWQLGYIHDMLLDEYAPPGSKIDDPPIGI